MALSSANTTPSMATTPKANGSCPPGAQHVGVATSANTRRSPGPWSKMNMSHHPEYDVGAGGPSFARDAHGKRLAPISQLNSPVGRKLARPRTLAQARSKRDVSETASVDTSHFQADSFDSGSASGLNHIQCQLGAPLRTQDQHVQQTADVARSTSSQLGYARKLSDRNLLASQQTRRAASDTTNRRSSAATEVKSGTTRSSTAVSLKRTLTVRRSSTARQTSIAKCRNGQQLPGRSATFSAGTTIRSFSTNKDERCAPNVSRRFSFDYGPEILSLAPSQDHERKPEPKKWCQCKHPLPIIPNPSKICATCDQVPKLTVQLERRRGEIEIDGRNSEKAPDVAIPGSGVRPPQTFEEILGCVKRLPTALVGS